MAYYNYSRETKIEDTPLQKHYECHVSDSGERRIIGNPFDKFYSSIDDDTHYNVERIYNIKIGERDFSKLLRDIDNNKTILDNLNDPIIHDMYYKLLTYIKLRT